MSVDLKRAKAVRESVRAALYGSASAMKRIPEIEREEPALAARKLEVQMFHLTDALVDTVAVLDQLIQRVDELERRRR